MYLPIGAATAVVEPEAAAEAPVLEAAMPVNGIRIYKYLVGYNTHISKNNKSKSTYHVE